MTATPTALLTVSIGPVHSFIALARRVADQWAGSRLLTHLVEQAVAVVETTDGCEMVFPAAPSARSASGLPNRFVCRVPEASATDIATEMAETVRGEWLRLVSETAQLLVTYLPSLKPADAIGPGAPDGGQAGRSLEIAWSWVPETGDYAADFKRGALQFAASRVFRPMPATAEPGEQCAICGERSALPNGDRATVRRAWPDAEKSAPSDLRAYVRADQGRLCLVCMTKRLYPRLRPEGNAEARFADLQSFQPERDDDRPYIAVVAMDGDHMGRLLGRGPDALTGSDVERFHRNVSERLTSFATSLVTAGRCALNLKAIGAPKVVGTPPQLIYAGGEDVLFVTDPRDAVAVATAVRNHYRRTFADLEQNGGGEKAFTMSAALVFAHSKQPAGSMFRDAEELLKRKAKDEAGRDAIAIRLSKRGGPPVEVAFKWDEPIPWGTTSYALALADLIGMLDERSVSSGIAYRLVADARVLGRVFRTGGAVDYAAWDAWVRRALARAGASGADAVRLSETIAPLLCYGKAEAIRIARFLATEVA